MKRESDFVYLLVSCLFFYFIFVSSANFMPDQVEFTETLRFQSSYTCGHAALSDFGVINRYTRLKIKKGEIKRKVALHANFYLFSDIKRQCFSYLLINEKVKLGMALCVHFFPPDPAETFETFSRLSVFVENCES
jgi:hypothetical protein